jgi:hypothetical protein
MRNSTQTPNGRAGASRPSNTQVLLQPVWRFYPHARTSAAIALDPREAAWVLEHGATIDGERYTASLKGWSTTPDLEGRITVRLDPAE